MKKRLFFISIFSVLTIISTMVTMAGYSNMREESWIRKIQAREEAKREEDRNSPSAGRKYVLGIITQIDNNLPKLDSQNFPINGKNILAIGDIDKLSVGSYGIHIKTANGSYVIHAQGEGAYDLSQKVKERGTVVIFPTQYHLSGRDVPVDIFFNNISRSEDSAPFPRLAGLIQVL